MTTTTADLPTGPLVNWEPGLAYPVSLDAVLEDGMPIGVRTWVMVWDYEETGDWREGRALITQADLDKHGRPMPYGGPTWATIRQGEGFRVSESLLYRFTYGDQQPLPYKPGDPKSNSADIMRGVYREQADRRISGGKLTTRQVGERLGIKGATWRAYVARGQAPEPDGHYDARTPYWTAETVDRWKASRPRSE
jgi:hypothetical protein